MPGYTRSEGAVTGSSDTSRQSLLTRPAPGADRNIRPMQTCHTRPAALCLHVKCNSALLLNVQSPNVAGWEGRVVDGPRIHLGSSGGRLWTKSYGCLDRFSWLEPAKIDRARNLERA